LSEPNVSAQHAQIIVDENNNVYLNDLNSKNGTFVNGHKIHQPVLLRRGDSILFGSTKFNWANIIPANSGVANKAKTVSDKQTSTLFLYSFIIAIAILLVILGINYFIYDSRATNKETNLGNPNNKTVSINIPEKIVYDFSCIYSDDAQDINNAGDAIDAIRTQAIDQSGVTVSVAEEMEFARKNHSNFIGGKSIITDERNTHLQQILKQLISEIDKPNGFNYTLYLLNSKEINVWTFGGRIYFTTGMLDFTKSDDEIAGILGHEINHNELGHINLKLRAQKLSTQTFGTELGTIATTIDGIIRSPFGKKDEAHCDFKGADLCIKANFKPCDIVELWNRMSKNEKNNTPLNEFLSSHPLSSNRRDCLKNHLKTNYKLSCE
jgi:Zn-dependent protease with chaperone function